MLNAQIRIWELASEFEPEKSFINTKGILMLPPKTLAAMLRVLADEIDPQKPKMGPVYRSTDLL